MALNQRGIVLCSSIVQQGRLRVKRGRLFYRPESASQIRGNTIGRRDGLRIALRGTKKRVIRLLVHSERVNRYSAAAWLLRLTRRRADPGDRQESLFYKGFRGHETNNI